MDAIGFLILHYKTYNETINCIKSIEELKDFGFKKQIIVIDNNSDDGSFEKIIKKYSDKNFKFFSLVQNIGFSKANNFGYNKFRELENIKFLIVCNSDIKFIQNNFIQLIEQSYNNLKFHVLGPDIFCPETNKNISKGHQSPAYPWEHTYYYTKMKIIYNNIFIQKLLAEGYKMNIKRFIFYGLVKTHQVLELFFTKFFFHSWRTKPHANVPLHGSCFILSKLFIEDHDILFEPETFFYYEELLLYQRMKKENLRFFYDNNLKVNHLQSVATNNSEDTNKKRNLFIAKNLKASAEIYLKTIEKKEKIKG